MNKKEAWERFYATGSVADYLREGLRLLGENSAD